MIAHPVGQGKADRVRMRATTDDDKARRLPTPEVDAGGQDHEGHAEREDADHGYLAEDVCQVAGVEEDQASIRGAWLVTRAMPSTMRRPRTLWSRARTVGPPDRPCQSGLLAGVALGMRQLRVGALVLEHEVIHLALRIVIFRYRSPGGLDESAGAAHRAHSGFDGGLISTGNSA